MIEPVSTESNGARTFLRLLVWVRYAAVVGLVVAVLGIERLIGLELPTLSLAVVSGAWLALNLATHRRLTWTQPVSDRTIMRELAADLLALTGLLFFTGGPTNPFVSLYLLPVALGALVLTRAKVAALGAVAATAYTALLFNHLPLPHAHGAADFDLHVVGMWVNFLVSTVLLVGFLVHFVSVIARERARVAEMREGVLRDESLLALGFLAAGTAHELNTPLTTMRMLVDEWRTAPIAPDDLDVLSAQIERCSQHVRALASIATQEAGASTVNTPVVDFLRDTVQRWHALRPSIDVDLAVDDVAPLGHIPTDATLPQAIANLLNNAADASVAMGRTGVRVEAEGSDGLLNVRILDRGPGLTGLPRGNGLGIGLLISNATVERFGGRVRQFAREGGGCVTEVELPLKPAAAFFHAR